MRPTTTALILLTLLNLSTSAPTKVSVAPRCRATLFPFLAQQLTEASPNNINANTLSLDGDFHVAQSTDPSTGAICNRIYQIIAFNNIPSGSYGCQLNAQFPSSCPIATTGTPTLNVQTLYADSPSSITYPNDWSWNTFWPDTSPAFGSGSFGTITFEPGQTTTINSMACPAGGGNMAFVFEIAEWVDGNASVEFEEYVNKMNGAGLTGAYLTYDC
ncbi:hypothetical protein L207DRAFT_572984 [Hyaloscypha variabilis F]|uniref:Ubiquitin 3 binding protein But2 C-terminal domain-containing protein n=1 Tax=Hyaloscypha variabilis (strain UAMH 11265 / GT02V1 / F) TaxID=1149755 RepID=A0A2J6QYH5_HYAVF|nr:hypothetical protein L207DRAFT_572984 [Hyaloscypha variabilis F]